MKTIILILMSFLSFHAGAWAADRCQEIPLEQGVQEACRPYLEMDQRFGRHSQGYIHQEGAECKKFYTAVIQARNHICNYANEEADVSAPIRGVGAGATGEQNLSPAQVAQINGAARAVHQKYHGLLTNSLMELILTWGQSPPGTYKRALVNSADFNRTQLTSEAHCGRGLRGPIPSFRAAGVSSVMREHSEKAYEKIEKAVREAINYAREGIRSHGQVQSIAGQNTSSLNSLQTAAPDTGPAGAQPGSPLGSLVQKGVVMGAAKHAAVDTAAEKLVHQGLHRTPAGHMLGRAAPIGGHIAVLALSLGASALINGKVDAGTVVVASVSLLGVGPGLAAVTIEYLIRNEMALQQYYRNWGPRQLEGNPDISAQELGQAFCQHRKELENEEKQKKQAEQQQRQAEAQRILAQRRQQMQEQFQRRQRDLQLMEACRNQPDPPACIARNR